MSVIYTHLTYEEFKALEEQMKTFRETTHKTEGGLGDKIADGDDETAGAPAANFGSVIFPPATPDSPLVRGYSRSH